MFCQFSAVFLDAVKTISEKEGKQTVKSDQSTEEVVEIDASLERNVVDLLCNTLLNLPVSSEDIKDALYKVIQDSLCLLYDTYC